LPEHIWFVSDLCKLESGLSSVIVDIEESIGDGKLDWIKAFAMTDNEWEHVLKYNLITTEVGQATTPKELPIVGDPWNQIDLSLVQSDKRYFRLHGKKLQLSQPLDRDHDDISSIVFQVNFLFTFVVCIPCVFLLWDYAHIHQHVNKLLFMYPDVVTWKWSISWGPHISLL